MATPPRRRWFQFGVRSLLLLTVALAIPLAWVAKERHQSQREQQLAEQLRMMGAAVSTFGGPYDSWTLYANNGPQGWSRNLARLALGERVLAFWIGDARIHDITPLTEFTNLQWLNLSGASVSHLAPLAECSKLKYLELNGIPITKEQIETLQKALPNCDIRHDPYSP